MHSDFQAALPIRLDCTVAQNGLEGNIFMWQESNSTPTFIYGLLNTTAVDRTKSVLSESIPLSRSTCTVSEDMNITMPPIAATPAEDLEADLLEIRFNNTDLAAYKKTNLRVNMIFIDVPHNKVASLVSVTQGDLTLVMKTPLPTDWTVTDGDGDSEGLIEGNIEATESPLDVNHLSDETTEFDPFPQDSLSR
jgi:hypothetical protein